MTSKVVVALPLAEHLLKSLDGYDVSHFPLGRADEEAFRAAVSEADGLLVSSNVMVDAEVITLSPTLRVISTMSVGLDHIDLREAKKRGIVVTIAAVLSDAVADLTMALMTMLARRLTEAIDVIKRGGWNLPLGSDIAGKTLLIVGFGRIGQTVAARALAAKMDVVYFDERNDLPPVEGARGVRNLSEGLEIADFVSLHCDLNDRTRNLIRAGELRTMKPSAYLINTARGGVVDQVALTEALLAGEISGAALDVLREEPPEPDEPLLSMANVIVVPHIGSATVETREAMAECAVGNLIKALAGEKTPFAIT